jgi:hypothetical protein
MKKLIMTGFFIAAISVAASAQTKNAHGKTVSSVAKTTTPGTTHGKTVSAVAKKKPSTVIAVPVYKKPYTNNKYKVIANTKTEVKTHDNKGLQKGKNKKQ